MSKALPVVSTGTQKLLITKPGVRISKDVEARKNNFMAVKIIAEVLRSTLGPKGMDKMLVDTFGDVKITNDGATILKELSIEHPAAKMLVEIAKAQDFEVGDGTTTAVVLAGELIKKAEKLMAERLHATVITAGFRKAAQKAIEELRRIAIPVDIHDKPEVLKVALTSIGGRSPDIAKERLASVAYDAVMKIAELRGEDLDADIDKVQIVKKTGGSLLDTNLVNGIIIDKHVAHPHMPKRVEQARIAIFNCHLEVEKPEFSTEIRIKDPKGVKAFLDEETSIMREMVEQIKTAGANVVISQKRIDDMTQHFLAKEKIMGIQQANKFDVQKLAQAVGGQIVTNVFDLKPKYLGSCDVVEEKEVGGDRLIFAEGCRDPKALSILIRGGLERLTEEAERALNDALNVITDVVKTSRIVAGGGAVEVELAKRVRSFAASVGGKEQLAIEEFASALEVIPKTLAENAGLNPIDVLTDLRAAHERGASDGLDVFSGKPRNMLEAGIVEPLLVKEQAIRSAVEAATMVIRIDDVIAAARVQSPTPTKSEGLAKAFER